MADKDNLYIASGSVDPKLNSEIAVGPNYEGLKPLGDPFFKVPFRGGSITVRDKAMLNPGEYSMVQNMRGDHPGFTKRKGCIKLHDTADGTNKVMTVYQFKKDRVSEKHFYSQFSDGDVLEATNDPPGVTTGVFGTVEAHAGTSTGMIPASWGNIKDQLIYSNGSDQHQIYAGDSSYVQKFIVYKGTAAIPRIPKWGADYSSEVSDGRSTTVAVLDSLDTAANHDYFFIKVPVPVKSFTFTVGAGNSNASTMTIKYWKSDMTWTAVSNLSDATVDTNETLYQTGKISFDAQSDCLPTYLFGQSGYWYRCEVSAALDAEVEISAVTFDCDWQDIVNMWDGVRVNAIEIQYYDDSASVYYTYGSTSAEIDSMVGTDPGTVDKLYFGSVDPIEGFYVDVGETPNTTAATTIDFVYYWNGIAWVAVGNLVDGTSGLSKSGWVTFDQEASEPTQFNDLPYRAYWYYFTTSKTLSDDVIIGIQCMPYFDIEDFGVVGRCNGVWKNRAAYSFNFFGEYLYISAESRPLVMNGHDYGILRPGDGRSNRVVAMRSFQNELMVWQQERGLEGGCVTLYEGYSPQTFGKLLLSTQIGAMNAKCVTVVDGVNTAIGSNEGQSEKALAFWLSKYGVCVTDGNNVAIISQPIQNYFNPNESECIRRGYENEMWLAYDSSCQVLRMGIVSGVSATLPNIFPVFDLIDSVWYFDVLAQELSCMCECEAEAAKPDSSDTPVIQVGGGIDDGFVYLLNYGANDVTTAIDSYIDMEINGMGEYILLRELLIRVKAQTGDLDITITKNALAGLTKTAYTTVVENANQIIRRHRINLNLTDQLLTLKFQSDATSELLTLYDLALRMYLVGER